LSINARLHVVGKLRRHLEKWFWLRHTTDDLQRFKSGDSLANLPSGMKRQHGLRKIVHDNGSNTKVTRLQAPRLSLIALLGKLIVHLEVTAPDALTAVSVFLI